VLGGATALGEVVGPLRWSIKARIGIEDHEGLTSNATPPPHQSFLCLP